MQVFRSVYEQAARQYAEGGSDMSGAGPFLSTLRNPFQERSPAELIMLLSEVWVIQL